MTVATRRALALLTGASLGAGLALGAVVGDAASAVAMALLFGLFVFTLRALSAFKVPSLAALCLLALALRFAVAAGLFAWSMAQRSDGFFTLDDRAYAHLAWAFVGYLRDEPVDSVGPPRWAGDAYLFGTWVYLEAAVFAIVGYKPLVAIALNGTLFTLALLPLHDMGLRVFGARPAIVAVGLAGLFPSLIVWSSLNLKDALAILLVEVILWSAMRFALDGGPLRLVGAYAALVPMESLRRYLFFGLAILVPAAVLTAFGPRKRTASLAVTVALSAVFVIATQATQGLGSGVLAAFEATRQAMGQGARTSFVAPLTIQSDVGDTYVVPGATLPPSSSVEGPQVVHVDPSQVIVVLQAGQTVSRPPPGTVYVHPGDVVVVGPPETAPAPEPARRSLPIVSSSVRFGSTSGSDPDLTVRTISHLPVGLAFALFAPFPWDPRRALDLLTIPDILLWYAVLVAAAVTVVRSRKRWRLLAPTVLFVIGVLGLLALAEGNVGTLYRHRAMVIPSAVLLAGPTLAAIRARR